MKRYKVLWIDDQFEDQEGLLEFAYLNGIDIFPFKTSKKGMEELNNNLYKYDAIILDAKVYDESEDEAAKLTGLTNSIYKIKELNHKRVVPYFIFTGQPDLVDNNTFSELVGEVKIYKKSRDNDQLFIDLKAMADQQIFTQIRHRYQKVLEVCSEKYLGEEANENILYILSIIDQDELNNQFIVVRKIVEDIFKCFHKYELLPVDFVTGGVSLSESSKFLCGYQEKGFTLNATSKIPKVISDGLHNILNITQPAAHRAKIDEHLKIANSTYLIKSCVFQLLDIIVWVKTHIDSDPIKNNWIKSETAEIVESELIGFLLQDEDSHYYMDNFTFQYTNIHGKYNVGDKLEITKSTKNTNPKTSKYEFFVINFKKVDN
ncbi:hypothetical protein [Flavobacterium sp. HJJ]|uniref:hypothetical protein n=1 Tax=Flavobacterium sp. HJJ TaxID=2783792 RepID=UPI00188C26AE|nr:hypothetical protein [Flavobacterium sp. HJJ]MBF4473301.1 hypothetical protein [Flavobacterium sp. HJJ]